MITADFCENLNQEIPVLEIKTKIKVMINKFWGVFIFSWNIHSIKII